MPVSLDGNVIRLESFNRNLFTLLPKADDKRYGLRNR